MLRHVTSCHVMSRYATSEIQIKIDVQKGADTHTASAVYNLVIYINMHLVFQEINFGFSVLLLFVFISYNQYYNCEKSILNCFSRENDL